MLKKFIRNMNNNYLQLSGENACISEPDYKIKMLMHNDIPAILPFTITYTDNSPNFSYRITGMQPLMLLLENKKITYDDFFNMISSLRTMIENIDKYILDINCILLLPDLIYAEPETFCLSFCYYPMYTGNFHEDFKELLRFFLNHIDHGDDKCIVWAYGIQQASLRNDLSYLQILDECLQMKPDTSKPIQNTSNFTNSDTSVVANIESDGVASKAFAANPFASTFPPLSAEHEQFSLNLKSFLPYGICLIASFIMLIFFVLNFCALHFFSPLISLILAVVCLSAFIYTINMCITSKDKFLSIHVTEDIIPVNPPALRHEFHANTSPASPASKKDSGDYVFGKTVLLYTQNPGTADSPACTLIYSANEDYGDIIIKDFPFTIGKLSCTPGYVISNPLISRLHARIDYDRSDGKYYIEDLNSTNGTFLNDIPLSPNTPAMIKSGDKICFAQINYIFKC